MYQSSFGNGIVSVRPFLVMLFQEYSPGLMPRQVGTVVVVDIFINLSLRREVSGVVVQPQQISSISAACLRCDSSTRCSAKGDPSYQMNSGCREAIVMEIPSCCRCLGRPKKHYGRELSFQNSPKQQTR